MKSHRLLPGLFALALSLGCALLIGCSQEDKAAQHLADANRHFQNREFEKAKIEYVNVLRSQPTNAFAVLQLGKVFLAQGQLLEAAPMVVWSRRHFPEDMEIREAFMDVLQAAGGDTNRVRLRGEIDELLSRDPSSAKGVLTLTEISRTPEEVAELTRRLSELRSKAGERSVYRLVDAELARRRGDSNACETAIREAIRLEPTNLTAQATWASFLLAVGRQAEGEAAFEAAAKLAPPSSPVRERWGRYLLRSDRIDQARVALDEINSQAPERVTAWAARAELALREQKFEDAERYLARALSQAPGNADSLRVQAQLRLARGKVAEAVRDLEKVVERLPGSARSQYQLAVAHLLNKDSASAAAALEVSVQSEPGFAEAVLLLAELDLGRGQGQKATLALRDLIQRDPQNERAHLQLLRAERTLGRLDDALSTASRARRLFPTNATVALQLGLVLRQSGHPAEARIAFEDAVKLAPNDLAPFEQLVQLDVGAKDFDGALRRVKARIDLNPKEPVVWLVKSEVHRIQGDSAQSEAALRQVLEIDSGNADALLGLARLALAAGKKQDGMAELEKILQRRPSDAQALLLAGLVRAELGEYAAAREMYERVVALQPQNALALNNLADLMAERFNQVEEARVHALKARQVKPDDAAVADTLGWIEYRRGQYADALRLISEAAGKLGEVPEVQYHLGMTQYMMGLEEPARAALERAVADSKEFAGKSVARDYLAMLQVDGGKIDDAAVRALEQRRKDAPGDLIALTRLGAAYEHTGAFEKSREVYEAALKVNPQSVPVLSRLASLYAERLNNPTKAIELARIARGLAPADASVALALGRLALAAGDQAWAYSLLQESARRLTNGVEAPYFLGWAAFGMGRTDEATRVMASVVASGGESETVRAAGTFLEMVRLATNAAPTAADAIRIQKVLEAEPGHGAALYAYGWVAESQGQFANARTAYENLLGRYSGFTPAMRQLTILCSERLGDDAKALELGTKARQAYPRDDVLAAALGKAIARRGDYGYAVQLLTEASRTRTRDGSLYYHLGLAQEGLKKTAEAKSSFEKCITLEPDAPFVEDAKKRLEKLKAG